MSCNSFDLMGHTRSRIIRQNHLKLANGNLQHDNMSGRRVEAEINTGPPAAS